MSDTPRPSPLLLLETITAYQRTGAIRAAIELDLFSAIAAGSRRPEEIGARCGTSERGTRILCDALTVMGFLTKQDGAYSLTPDSALFLDRRSPAYLGGITGFLLAPDLMDAFDRLAEAVRRGGTALPEGGSVSEANPIWVDFARAMAPMMAGPARDMAGLLAPGLPEAPRVLDVAAGHGLFGVAMAERSPAARVTALDWEPVLEVARETAERAGVADRFDWLAGDAFTVDLGGPYDLALLPNFLHHFDPATCTGFLRRLRGALAPGGRVAALEFVPNEDRVSPPAPALFSMVMLATTAAGDAFTLPEYAEMFREAGLGSLERWEIPPSVESVLVCTL
jgi:2-polyprenyl-3-methyl-5-hydroxy-6-metoxy-1,4-benzoquinol methylase